MENINNTVNKKFDIEISRHGIPALWECGGSYTKTGFATIIADKSGYRKTALCIRYRGTLACSNHALVPIKEGDVVIESERQRDKVSVVVYRITEIDMMKHTATAVLDTTPIEEAAIEAAIGKCWDYHCRVPYYIVNPCRCPSFYK